MLLFDLALASCPLHTAEQPPRLDLLTAAPGPDLFSSMGHTALIFSGGGLERPLAFDWGAYDAQEASVLRFLRGEQPFYLRGQLAGHLLGDLARQERTVVLQELPWDESLLPRLTHDVGARYTYHWRLDNCATRARDCFLDPDDTPVDTTARYEASRHLWRWPVLGFAWRFTTSQAVDRPLTAFERTMVPEHLMRAVESPACTLERRYGWAPERPPPTWPWAIPGVLGSVAVLSLDRWRRTLVTLYGTVIAMLGTSSFLLWSVSSLEGVGPTENWLFAGPQSWLLVLAAWHRGLVPLVVPVLAGLGALAVVLAPFSPLDNRDMLAAFVPGLWACCAALWRAR